MVNLSKLDGKHGLFYDALSSFPQAVTIINKNDQLVFTNRKFDELFSHRMDREISVHHMFTGADFEQIEELKQQALMREKTRGSMTIDGLEWELVLQKLSIGNDESEYLMIIFQPVTGLKHDQVPDDKQRKDFIQIAAHELRTPLTAIKGFIQLVLERYKERNRKWFFQPTSKLMSEIERDQTFFKVIYDEALRLDQLTNELLSIFKIDQGRFEMKFERANFTELVHEAIEEFVIPTEYHHIHYINQESELPVNVDVQQVKRVISNLLSNAVKYSPANPDIYVQIKKEAHYIVLSVKDGGIGIPKEQQHRIFERFFRAYSPEHESIQGYGIGLHICREIMSQHNGELHFESSYGNGSTFFVKLPLYES